MMDLGQKSFLDNDTVLFVEVENYKVYGSDGQIISYVYSCRR